jgi:hypothetical protein
LYIELGAAGYLERRPNAKLIAGTKRKPDGEVVKVGGAHVVRP